MEMMEGMQSIVTVHQEDVMHRRKPRLQFEVMIGASARRIDPTSDIPCLLRIELVLDTYSSR